jgi:hypothetical protein
MLFAFQPSTEIAAKTTADLVGKAGGSVIESGVLGALLILSVLGNIALVWLLVRVQNARVTDVGKISTIAQEMVSTFARAEASWSNLNESSKTQVTAMQALTNTLNTVVISALNRGPKTSAARQRGE